MASLNLAEHALDRHAAASSGGTHVTEFVVIEPGWERQSHLGRSRLVSHARTAFSGRGQGRGRDVLPPPLVGG